MEDLSLYERLTPSYFLFAGLARCPRPAAWLLACAKPPPVKNQGLFLEAGWENTHTPPFGFLTTPVKKTRPLFLPVFCIKERARQIEATRGDVPTTPAEQKRACKKAIHQLQETALSRPKE
jgi:hypothetical protein